MSFLELAAAAAKQREQSGYTASSADRHVLYQESVQGVELELDYVAKIFKQTRGRKPTKVREDFCGTALLACEWVIRNSKNTAIGVDLDQEVLNWGRKNNLGLLTPKQAARVKLMRADVLNVKTEAVDACLAFNFSYWIFQERDTLKKYFRQVHKSLATDGMFFMDTFGGYEAHRTQEEERDMDDFTYVWDQAEYNPITNEMQCYIHFEFPDGTRMDQAFAYRWRLWGCMEIRDLLREAGFKKTRVFAQAFDDDTDEPLDEFYETEEIEDFASWIGYIVAEK